jgi:hypothetical protein
VSVAEAMVRKEQRMRFIARRHVYQIVKAVCNSPPFIFIIPSCGLAYGCTSLGSASYTSVHLHVRMQPMLKSKVWECGYEHGRVPATRVTARIWVPRITGANKQAAAFQLV